ncbi:glycosyltransferase family 2 protein [uncultured Psychroserpens sp.]|uniref:glycosyltransferase family 2 protein n=1 Tax=uncultured Psychroserpens sp. TaxID=255436 RepID=UPI002603A2D2|nr:glycosyltransferase family 2 protein [uncultured Psychroserpens sp.]
MNRAKPLVSICIPTFNGESYIAEAMESAINQDYDNLEIVISDDASKDNTLQIIESYKAKTQWPIYIHQHQPDGIGANWNHCIKQCQGAFVKLLFQDDILQPNCISELIQLALEKDTVGLVYSNRDFIYEKRTDQINYFISNYSNLFQYWESFEVKQGICSGRQYLKDPQFLNSPKNKIGEPTNVLIKRDCFETIGYFNEHMKQTLDTEFWYRIMKSFDIGFVNKKLASFRLHDEQASSVNKSKSHDDNQLLYHSYYKNLFWYLHPKNQWKLLKLYHPVFRFMVQIKRKFS